RPGGRPASRDAPPGGHRRRRRGDPVRRDRRGRGGDHVGHLPLGRGRQEDRPGVPRGALPDPLREGRAGGGVPGPAPRPPHGVRSGALPDLQGGVRLGRRGQERRQGAGEGREGGPRREGRRYNTAREGLARGRGEGGRPRRNRRDLGQARRELEGDRHRRPRGRRRGEESEFDAELRAQRGRFLSALVERRNEEKSKDDGGRIELTVDDLNPAFFQVANHMLGALGRFCARRARSSPLEVAWPKVLESGLLLPVDVISTYLYVVGAMTVSNAFVSQSDRARDRFRIPGQVATYHDLASRPTESSISLRIKGLADKGDARTAEEYLESFKRSIAERDAGQGEEDDGGDGSGRERPVDVPLHAGDRRRHLRAGDVRHGPRVSRAERPPPRGFRTAGGGHDEAGIRERVRARPVRRGLPGDGGRLPRDHERERAEAVERVRPGVRGVPSDEGAEDGEDDEDDDGSRSAVVSNIEEANPLRDMPLSRHSARPNEVVACRVNLDRSTGVCPVTSAVQRLILLGPDERSRLHDDLLDLSAEQFEAFSREDGKGRYARDELRSFSDWLARRTGRPFTAIIDGANVGYYMQSFDKGRFNYHQINYMVETLIDRGENPLVVVPGKYGRERFHSSHGQVQRLDREEVAIMNRLAEEGRMYRVPPRCLDDFYWMLASVSDQSSSSSRGPEDGPSDLSFVPGDDPRGRFPGTRPMLVTNDQMRDHKLELLEPRLFRRWYGCHIVNYSFTAFVLGESVAGNEIVFSQADCFSREIQGNDTGGDGDGDGGGEEGESAAWGGRAWHFPVSDWDLDESGCFMDVLSTHREEIWASLVSHGVVLIKNALSGIPHNACGLPANSKRKKITHTSGNGGVAGSYYADSPSEYWVQVQNKILRALLTDDDCYRRAKSRKKAIILSYSQGSENWAHQDGNDDADFPFQATVLLTDDKEFDGGDFYVAKKLGIDEIARTIVKMRESGDMVLFAASKKLPHFHGMLTRYCEMGGEEDCRSLSKEGLKNAGLKNAKNAVGGEEISTSLFLRLLNRLERRRR
ncbi:hypothetical protein THAOC_15979, partial [Thalassiosira oceanica]